MRSLRYLNSILTVLAVLLALNCWVLLAGTHSGLMPVNEAHAQGVGGAAQRQAEIVDQLKTLNKAVSSLEAEIKAGIKVEVTGMPKGD